MSFLEHLSELRNRLDWSALAILVASVVAYIYRDTIYGGLLNPLTASHPEMKLNYFAPTEPFFVYMRIALFGGITLASPFVIYQIWAFVAPGLTARERSLTRPAILLILLLFAAGVSFIYFMLLPASLGVLIGMANPGMEAELGQDRYFSFVIGLCLAGGILFELPVVLGLLGWLKIVSAAWLWKQSAMAFLALLILAAVITPTGDAFTMMILTAPLMLLYWLSIVIVWLINRSAGNNVSP
jgi:sec-independent protein translocase protein TatC